jgi:hypothetical protein
MGEDVLFHLRIVIIQKDGLHADAALIPFDELARSTCLRLSRTDRVKFSVPPPHDVHADEVARDLWGAGAYAQRRP